MLQKFNITTYAVALCLFGFMIFSAAPVFANDEAQGEFQDCKDMKWKDGPQEKKDCFKELAKSLINNDSGGQTNSSGSSTDEPFSEEVCESASLEIHKSQLHWAIDHFVNGCDASFCENNKFLISAGKC